jgi:hypothetical protein
MTLRKMRENVVYPYFVGLGPANAKATVAYKDA